MHISKFIIIFATKIIINFRIMLGISIFSLFVVYAILGIGYALNKMGRHISSYSGKSKEDAPKLTIEDMYSPNNKLSLFFKDGNSYILLRVF